MRFLGLVASQGGLFHLPENTFLKKVLQKRLNTKIFISDKPEFCGAIGAGLFAVDSDRLLERLECNALNINPKNLVPIRPDRHYTRTKGQLAGKYSNTHKRAY